MASGLMMNRVRSIDIAALLGSGAVRNVVLETRGQRRVRARARAGFLRGLRGLRATARAGRVAAGLPLRDAAARRGRAALRVAGRRVRAPWARRRSSAWAIRPGISDGMFATGTPAAWNAAIFSAAVPVPPEMIAPAWPMRL